MCKETFQCRCQERVFDGNIRERPVHLVAFDFDETLTMATFMPPDNAFGSQLDWSAKRSDEWNETDLVSYNFESPWMESRLGKLRNLLAGLAMTRTLAVISHNKSGAVGILNLLRLADLAKHFGAVWIICEGDKLNDGAHRGAYQERGKWKVFNPPGGKKNDHKADVLVRVRENPQDWFPQLANDGIGEFESLIHMNPESIALVDDERQNFRSWADSDSQCVVLRYCKVARYDKEYRDCGLMNQMGGLGAHSDDDFQTLAKFLNAPWEFPYEHREIKKTMGRQTSPNSMPRSDHTEEQPKAPRSRSKERSVT